MEIALAVILFVIVAVVRGLYLFFRWAVSGLNRLGTPGPTFAPQAMPQYQPVPLDPRTTAPFSPARRTDAGGPAVSREATTASFRAEEEQLVRAEPQSAFTSSAKDVSAASPEGAPLFNATSDFLRAFILQEALGPPLSRRQRQ